MVRVVLHMASDLANYGCISIFVTTSPRVPSKDLEPPIETKTSFRANMSRSDIEEEVLPRTTLLQQYHSPLHDNNNNIDDNGITLMDVGENVLLLTTSLKQRYSPYHNNDFHDNDDPVDDISNAEADNVCAKSSNSMRATHFNNACMMEVLVFLIFNRFSMRMSVKMIFLLITETIDLFLQWPVREGGLTPSQVLFQFCLRTWLLQAVLAILTQMISVWVSYSLRRMS